MDKRGKYKASALTPGAAAMLAHIPVPDDIDGPEADVIVQAGGRARQLRTGRAPPASPEPPRGKVHWDHLLDEMKWMQNEFSSERKIKIKQLKQTATKAVKSKRDLISRSETRAKEQQVKLVKCAQSIARDVMKFWAKARTVYNFMVQEKVNEIKRSKMDKELETFVQQSERFSRMLVGKPTTPASSAQASPETSAAHQKQLTSSNAGQESARAADSREQETTAADQKEGPSGDASQSGGAEGMSADDAQPEGPADGEWVESGEEEEDDEETLAAEEALAQQEGAGNSAAEADELQAEGDEDLAAFMARTYGISLADFASGNDTQKAVQPTEDDVMLGSSDDDVDLPDEMVETADGGASTSNGMWDAGNAGPSRSNAIADVAGPSRRSIASVSVGRGTAPAASSSWALDLMRAGHSDAAAAQKSASQSEQAGPSGAGAGPSGIHRSAAALSDKDDDEDDDLEDQAAGQHEDGEGSEEEWMHEEAIDDEATLEEEERLAGAEGYADPEAEKSALESAADQSLAEIAASMGLTLAQLLGQQPPPDDGEETAARTAQPKASPAATLPQAGSLPTPERQGKVTRRMAAEEQAAAEAAKTSEHGMKSVKADGSEAATPGDSSVRTKRAAKRVRAETGVSGGDPAGHADGGSSEPGRKSRRSVTNKSPSTAVVGVEKSSDKEGRLEQLAVGQDVKYHPEGDGVQVGEREGTHGNDQERGRTPEGTGADGLTGKNKARDVRMYDSADGAEEACEQDDDQPEGKESEEKEELEEGMEPVQVPFLLTAQMRSYQEAGLNWLVNLCKRNFNGILADEMGLGKTLQTISLLAWLAAECGSWGPHLVVVPTSVMLNWEMEFKKFAPAFKILTYYGTPRERKAKRVGWSKPNTFHVCITSYNLALQDVKIFKRRKWKYLILDEAHMIKNWRSQRWQALLNFSARHRLLITGTPLQNDLMELWSLMHFLMPHIFHSHAQFQDWFSNPLTGMVEGAAAVNAALVSRLHAVLRPFMLRRLKQEVEKQLPQKYEHIVMCRLSRRQRTLYDDFLGARSTKESMSSGSFIAIMNVLMQLRKVCNHPDLFEGRAIISAFDCDPLEIAMPKLVASIRSRRESYEDWMAARLMPLWLEDRSRVVEAQAAALAVPTIDPSHAAAAAAAAEEQAAAVAATAVGVSPLAVQALRQALTADARKRSTSAASTALRNSCTSTLRCAHSTPLYGCDLRSALRIHIRARDVHVHTNRQGRATVPDLLQQLVLTPVQRFEATEEILRLYSCVIPRARAPAAEVSLPSTCMVRAAATRAASVLQEARDKSAPFRTAIIRRHLYFPDRRLIQFDCGKLQQLAVLLQRLKAEGSRCLIFTQMSKMLDVLEAFLNLHAYVYMRLDGSTKPAKRQELMTRFNSNLKYFVFILSTRSGGVGINLTGANCVIFYDSDWNPAMDQQAQDRCHRIGQTREVHIYRLISHHTIEENILRKSNQKRHLDHLAIQSGGYSGGTGPSEADAAAPGGTSTGAGMGAADIREMLGANLAGGAPEDESNVKKDEDKPKDTDNVLPEQADLADEEVKKAMASAEDDADALAASAAEKELAEENAADFEDGGEGADGKSDGPAVLKATASDAHSMLKPIEKYAIWEAEVGPMDYEAMADAVMQQAQGDERAGAAEGEDPLAQLTAAGAAPPAEADDDNAEENICADWDPDSARTMFWRFLEEEEQKKAAFEAWQAEEAARSAAWAKKQAAAAETARAQQEAAEKEAAASLAAAGPPPAAVAPEAPKRPAGSLAFSPAEDRILCNAALAALQAGDTSLVKATWWDQAVSSQGAAAPRPAGSQMERAAVLLAAASDGRAESFRASISARIIARLPSSRTAAALASSVADSLYPRRFGATPPGVRAALLTTMSSALEQSTVQQAPQTQYLVRQLLRSATIGNFQSVLHLIDSADGLHASVQQLPGGQTSSQSGLPSSVLRNVVAGQAAHAALQTGQAASVPLQVAHAANTPLQARQGPRVDLQTEQGTHIPIQPSPLPIQTNPVPLQTNLVPLQTNPVPLLANSVPLQTNPVPLQTNPVPHAYLQAAQAPHAPLPTHASLQHRQPTSALAMSSMPANRGPPAPSAEVRQAQQAGPSSTPSDSIGMDMQWGARKGRGARRSGASRSSVSSQQDGQDTQSTGQVAVHSAPGGVRGTGSQNTYTQHAPAHMTGVTPGSAADAVARSGQMNLQSLNATQKHALHSPQMHASRAGSAADLAAHTRNPGTATQNSHGVPGSAHIMQTQPMNTAVPASLQISNPQLLTELQARAQQGLSAQLQLPTNGAAAVQRPRGMGSATNPILQSEVSAAAARSNGSQHPVLPPQHAASQQPILPPQHAATQQPVLPPQYGALQQPVLPPQLASQQQEQLLMQVPGAAAVAAQMQQQQQNAGNQGMWAGPQMQATRPTGGAVLNAQTAALLGSAPGQQGMPVQQQQNGAGLLSQRMSASQLMTAAARDAGLQDFQQIQRVVQLHQPAPVQQPIQPPDSAANVRQLQAQLMQMDPQLLQQAMIASQQPSHPPSNTQPLAQAMQLQAQLLQDPVRMQQAMLASQPKSQTQPHAFNQQPPQ